MRYSYLCPHCDEWRVIDWSKRRDLRLCERTGRTYLPPEPLAQPFAFVDTRQWPIDMELVVRAHQGRICLIPGCGRIAHTLGHRDPWSHGGKTAVDNLFPICLDCHQAKGELPLDEFLALHAKAQKLRQRAPLLDQFRRLKILPKRRVPTSIVLR